MRRGPFGGRHAGPVLAGLAAVVLVAGLHFARAPVLERVGLQVFDVWQRAAAGEAAGGEGDAARVVVVDIDEESLRRLGQWPWPRTELARLNRMLGEAGARVVAWDVVFSEPDRTSPAAVAGRIGDRALAERFAGLPDHDEVFAQSFAEVPVVLGMILDYRAGGRVFEPRVGIARLGSLPGAVETYRGSTRALPVLERAAAGAGSISHAKDYDGIVRRAPLVAILGGELVPTLSLEALRVAGGGDSVVVRTSDGSGGTAGAPGAVVSLRVGDIAVPVTDGGEIWLRHGGGEAVRTVPAWRLLDGAMDEAEMARTFGGAIVFVGASAAGLRDLVATPLATEVPGVHLHARATAQMLRGDFLERPDLARGVELFLTLLLGGGLALLLPRLGARAGAVVGAAMIAAVAAAGWFAFAEASYLFDPTAPVLAVVLVYTLQTVLVYYREERQRAYIHGAFDRYLSPELVRRIADDPGKLELGGEEREMSVLMCDIRGFSRISERYTPQQVIDFLIGFLTPMSDILLAHKATLDKYIGDAILAFWNAPLDDPDHHRNAARAALAMGESLDELNGTMPAREGQTWPGEVRIGIGLNSGLCCVGNMGSRRRLSYSLIGDTVNLTARLEGLTKTYGVRIVAGSDLAAHLDGFALLELDRVRVVGRDAPETIHALVGDEALAASDAFMALRTGNDAMLRAYRAMAWDAAREALQRLGEAYDRAGLEKLRLLYLGRIVALEADPPPPEWDGVYEATSK